jgi:uncharacterized protein YecE (DUF72 family)
MILVGTSGYNYPEWKGSFYPADLPATKFLPYYASKFPTVEINYTFYRMPTPKLIAGWRAQVPPAFRFTLKAPKRITHDKRLRAADVAESLQGFITAASELGPQMAALLFQLPPNFKKDAAVLAGFVETLPRGTRAAFEFRHPSWFDDETYALLRQHQLALCVADSEKLSAPVEITADYGYFRLRDEGYQQADIERWAGVLRALSGVDAFVYFKHEEQGLGPAFAKRLMALL